MSDNMPNTTPIPNQGDQGNGTSQANGANQQPAKPNIFVRGFRKAKEVVKEGWNEIKSHPITHGLMALGGAVGGGYVVYTVLDAQRPIVPETPAVPQIQEPGEEPQQQTTDSRVEYVDIPKDETATEEQQ